MWNSANSIIETIDKIIQSCPQNFNCDNLKDLLLLGIDVYKSIITFGNNTDFLFGLFIFFCVISIFTYYKLVKNSLDHHHGIDVIIASMIIATLILSIIFPIALTVICWTSFLLVNTIHLFFAMIFPILFFVFLFYSFCKMIKESIETSSRTTYANPTDKTISELSRYCDPIKILENLGKLGEKK